MRTNVVAQLKQFVSEVEDRWDSLSEREMEDVVMNDSAMKDEIADMAWDRIAGWKMMSVSEWRAAVDEAVDGRSR